MDSPHRGESMRLDLLCAHLCGNLCAEDTTVNLAPMAFGVVDETPRPFQGPAPPPGVAAPPLPAPPTAAALRDGALFTLRRFLAHFFDATFDAPFVEGLERLSSLVLGAAAGAAAAVRAAGGTQVRQG